jgi:hypothetical protein
VLPTFFLVNIFRKFFNLFSHQHFSEVLTIFFRKHFSEPYFKMLSIFFESTFFWFLPIFFKNVPTFYKNVDFLARFRQHFTKYCNIFKNVGQHPISSNIFQKYSNDFTEMLILFQHGFCQHFSKMLGKFSFLPPTAHPRRSAGACSGFLHGRRAEHRRAGVGVGAAAAAAAGERRDSHQAARRRRARGAASSRAGEAWREAGELAAAQPCRPPARSGRHGGRRRAGTWGRRARRREHGRSGGD